MNEDFFVLTPPNEVVGIEALMSVPAPLPGEATSPTYLEALDLSHQLSQMRDRTKMAPVVRGWAQACQRMLGRGARG